MLYLGRSLRLLQHAISASRGADEENKYIVGHDRNLTAVGSGTQVSVWRRICDKAREDQGKAQSPYLRWETSWKFVN
jgi:hypothetical protein